VSPISFFSVSEALRLLEEKSKIVLDTPVSREAIRRALKKTNFDLTKTTTGASPKKMMPNL
jgi:PleD family two-component response regulator